MSETSSLRGLRRPVVLIAFSGWNDAGEGATGVIEHLAELSDAEFAFALEPDDYYDFTENRPVLVMDGTGGRSLQWVTTEVLVGHLEGRDLVLISGPEPNFRWRDFCGRVVSALRGVRPERVLLLGAMLADSPHRRPVPIAENSTDYEGPTGIVGVLMQSCLDAGLPTTSLWASVPHYVADPPNPKVTLALLQRVEDALDLSLDAGDLPRQTAEWETRVDDLVTDPELATYIGNLEERYDDAVADGDQIAAEFERFLRRRNR